MTACAWRWYNVEKVGRVDFMGLFGKAENCCVCGSKGSKKIADGYICAECYKKMRGFLNLNKPFKEQTSSDLLRAVQDSEQNQSRVLEFTPTQKALGYLWVDEGRCWLIAKGDTHNDKHNPRVFLFDEILDFDADEDGAIVAKSGLGGAAVGGLLFGGAGALVGGLTGHKTKDMVNSLTIRIRTSYRGHPLIEIPLLTAPVKRGSFSYNLAKESATAILNLLAGCVGKHEAVPQSTSAADEILKLKALLDTGVLTPEEFAEAKRKALR